MKFIAKLVVVACQPDNSNKMICAQGTVEISLGILILCILMNLPNNEYVTLIDSLHPSQQFFSYVQMGLPWLTGTKQGLMCLAQGHNAVTLVNDIGLPLVYLKLHR